MTLNGMGGKVFSTAKLEAARASRLSGAYIKSVVGENTYSERLTGITDGAWAEYRYLDFNGETGFNLETYGSGAKGEAEIRTDSPDGECIGVVSLAGCETDMQHIYECNVRPIYGRKAVYLVFKSEGTMADISRLWFV